MEIDHAGGGSGNSLSQEVKEKYAKEGYSVKSQKIQTSTLKEIFGKYLNNGINIDFMNVDVEVFLDPNHEMQK